VTAPAIDAFQGFNSGEAGHTTWVFAIVLGWLAINLPGWPAVIRVAGLAIVLGAALNGVVIAANGRMPYDPAAVAKVSERAGLETPGAPRHAGAVIAVRGRILLTVAALATLLCTIGAPVSNGG
jgi:hypothetical protein